MSSLSVRRRPLLALAAAAVLPLPHVARAQAAGKLVIATQPGLGYAPMVIVKQRRWLEEAMPGLQVEWKVISSSVAIRESMLAGEVQVGCGSVAPFLIGRDRGFRTRLISALNTVDLWLLTNDPRVQSVKDLRPTDKVAVVAPDTNQAFMLRRAAQQAFGDARRSTLPCCPCRTRRLAGAADQPSRGLRGGAAIPGSRGRPGHTPAAVVA